jgi:solute:Na+ symporter, SSS family
VSSGARAVILKPLDWIIFSGLLAALVLLAWGVRRYMRSVSDFIILNRCMRKYLGLSTWGSEGIGLISIAYIAEQGFTSGLGYAWMTLLNSALYIPLFGIIGFGIRRFRATRVQTIPQYHEMRFSRGVRICSGVVLATGGILNMAIFPVVSSQFLVRFMALPESVDILGSQWQTVHLCMLVLIGLSLSVALMGGMVTVIVTDYVQGLILTIALFTVAALAIWTAGLSGIDRTMQEQFGEAGYNPFVTTDGGDGYGLTWVVFFVLSGVLAPLCFPPSTAKLSATDNTDTTRKMALLSQIIAPGRTMIILLLGVCALAAMGAAEPGVTASESYERYATATFIQGITPIGLLGLCAAGMVFAYITTDNSYYLAWSAILVNDVIAPMRGRPLTQRSHLFLLRVVMVCIAVFLFLWGLFYDPDESLLSYIYLTGAIMTAAGIITLFGLYWRRANSAGAYLTLALCLMIPVADLIGKKVMDDYPLKSHQSGLIALVLSFLAFFICGLVSSRGQARWHNYGREVREEDRLRRDAAKRGSHA